MFCTRETEQNEKEEVRLSLARNSACCDVEGYGWNPSSQIMFDSEFPLRQCIRGVTTSADTAGKCKVTRKKIAKRDALRAERNQACCQDPDKGWDPSSLDMFDKEWKEKKCLYQVETSEFTARRCRKIWRAADYICISPIVLVVIAAIVLATGAKRRGIWIALIVVGIFGTVGWSVKTYTEKNFEIDLIDIADLKGVSDTVTR